MATSLQLRSTGKHAWQRLDRCSSETFGLRRQLMASARLGISLTDIGMHTVWYHFSQCDDLGSCADLSA